MRVRALLCALPLSAAIAASASAAGGISIRVSPSTVHRGHTVRVYGNVAPCPKGSQVELLSNAFVHTHDFAGLPEVIAIVRAHGAYSVTTRIPATKAPGHYSITGRCGGGNLGVSATLHVES
jgi:hypothetical protein